jgi:hypothetical protein
MLINTYGGHVAVSVDEDWNVCECGSSIKLDSSAMNSDTGNHIPIVDSLHIRAL